jgi:DNA-binding transcriptional LysR family regulator
MLPAFRQYFRFSEFMKAPFFIGEPWMFEYHFTTASLEYLRCAQIIDSMSFDTRLLNGLNVLAAVVEARSFVRAGEALGLTQSGISRAIQRLEQHLGVRLLDRTPKMVALTTEGRRFYQEIAPLLTGLEAAASDLAQASTSVRGRLRINVDPTFARLILAPRFGAFLERYPELSVEIAVRDRLGDPIAEGFDLAVRFGESEPSSFIGRRLLQLRVLTCAAPAYLTKRGYPRKPADLANGRHECILFRDPVTGQPFPWEFHRGKKVVTVPVEGRLILNDAATHLALCVAGYGVAQVFELGIAQLLKDKVLVNLFPEWSDELFPLYALYPSKNLPPAKIRAFLDFFAALPFDSQG